MKKVVILFVLFFSFNLLSQEICTNGIDDDNDGLIDLNDSECVCQSAGGEPLSLIPNPSFEEFTACCPASYSELYCADSWIQASEATSDYMNSCGFLFFNIEETNLYPFADGEGAVGAWIQDQYREYVGACLTSPMLAGESYTIQFYSGGYGTGDFLTQACDLSFLGPLNITLYGSPSCSDLPFTGLCPSSEFIELGSASLVPDGNYYLLTITFVPTTTLETIVIGGPCVLPSTYVDNSFNECQPYFVFDKILVNESSNFGSNLITKTGNICTDDVKLYASPSEVGGTYQWFEDGIAIQGQTSDTLFVSQLGFDDGLYQLMYSLNGECIVDTSIISPFIPFNVQAADVTICLGGTVPLVASGASAYVWSPATFLSSTSGSTVDVTPTENITYKIVGNNDEGCLDSTTVDVTVGPLQVTVNDAIACFVGENVVLIANGAQNYTWSPVSGLSSAIGNEVVATIDSAIVYTVVGESDGCLGQAQSTIFYSPSLDFDVNINPNPANVFNPVVLFSASASDNYSYQWEFNNLVFQDTNNFYFQFPTIDSIYSVLVIAQTETGCSDSLITSIRVLLPSEFYVPNSFTPNGDELNNNFKPIYLSEVHPKEYNLILYNRWGEVVFESNDLNVGWDGTYAEKIVQQGLYSYQISYIKELSSERIVINGHVLVLK